MARTRLAVKLKRQDWLAVLIDVAIVIVGVFLGLQANNWNERLKDRRSADAYLGRIADDLRSDTRELDQRETYWRGSQEAGQRALRFVEEGQLDGSSWQTLDDLYEAGQLWVFSPNDATYRELVSAGHLDLVSDVELRRKLADYYVAKRAQDQVLFQAVPPYRDHIRAVVPYALQEYILNRCQTGLSGSFRSISCPPPNRTANYDAVLRAITSNRELMGELRTWMITLRYSRAVGRQDHDLAVPLAKLTEQERRRPL